MRFRLILLATLFLPCLPYATASQPAEKDLKIDPPLLERVLPDATRQTDGGLLSKMASVKPEMPLGPADLLKAYEIGMNVVVQQMSDDFRGILQAQQKDQITRDEAEYLLQQRYQLA